MSAIQGNIVWKRTPDGEKYQGIGKDVLNIEHLPALYDDLGVFGNPTGDSRRTMIEKGTDKRLLYVIYSFDGAEQLENLLNMTQNLLERYAAGRDFSKSVLTA